MQAAYSKAITLDANLIKQLGYTSPNAKPKGEEADWLNVPYFDKRMVEGTKWSYDHPESILKQVEAQFKLAEGKQEIDKTSKGAIWFRDNFGIQNSEQFDLFLNAQARLMDKWDKYDEGRQTVGFAESLRAEGRYETKKAQRNPQFFLFKEILLNKLGRESAAAELGEKIENMKQIPTINDGPEWTLQD